MSCQYAHRPRTLSDTAAGIRVEYGCNNNAKFYVHCLECCSDFGPIETLAGAQALGRVCGDCLWTSAKKRREND